MPKVDELKQEFPEIATPLNTDILNNHRQRLINQIADLTIKEFNSKLFNLKEFVDRIDLQTETPVTVANVGAMISEDIGDILASRFYKAGWKLDYSHFVDARSAEAKGFIFEIRVSVLKPGQ